VAINGIKENQESRLFVQNVKALTGQPKNKKEV